MIGLRTQENEKFLRFFQKVQEEANSRDAVFFLDFGECRDEEFENMLLDDLCGWLIPISKVGEFEPNFKLGKSLENWDAFITWCLPQVKNNKAEIEFKRF